MAKSQSESRLRGAFPYMSLRGAEGDEAISRIRRGEANNAWPGQKDHCEESRFLVSLGTGSAISIIEGSLNEAGLKIGFTEEKCYQIT